MKIIARENGLKLRSNSRKHEIIDQIVSSGIEIKAERAEELLRGIGTIGRPARLKGLKAELTKHNVKFNDRETVADLKTKLDTHLEKREKKLVDLNKDLEKRSSEKFDKYDITYEPLMYSDFESRYKIQDKTAIPNRK